MKFLKTILAVTVVYCLVEGLDATVECQYCDFEESCDPTDPPIKCSNSSTSRCVTAKILDNGVVKYKKTCESQQLCNQTADLCSIPDRVAASQTCLAAGCCDIDRCEANLTSLLTPASTTYVANAMPTATTRDVMPTPTPTPTSTPLVLPETRATVEMAMSSADISPTTAMPSSSSSSSSSSRAVKDTVPTGVETTMEYKSKWMSESVSSMPVVEKPGTSAQTKGSGTSSSQILVKTRPTCGDSAGMRHVVSPLAVLTVSLLVLVF